MASSWSPFPAQSLPPAPPGSSLVQRRPARLLRDPFPLTPSRSRTCTQAPLPPELEALLNISLVSRCRSTACELRQMKAKSTSFLQGQRRFAGAHAFQRRQTDKLATPTPGGMVGSGSEQRDHVVVLSAILSFLAAMAKKGNMTKERLFLFKREAFNDIIWRICNPSLGAGGLKKT